MAKTTTAVTKNQIKEMLARRPTLLENKVKLVDTDIHLFAGDWADLLLIDGKKRLIVVAVSDQSQSLRTNKGVHLLKEGFHAWNWLIYFKESLMEACQKKTGVEPLSVPPRLAVIAPKFTKGVVDLAKAASRALTDLRLYTYDPENLAGNEKPFTRLSLKTNLPPSTLPDPIGSYHAEKIESYWYNYGGEFTEARNGPGYVAYTLEDVLSGTDREFRKGFERMHNDIMNLKLSLRPIYQRNLVTYKDELGNPVASLSPHDISGFSLLVGEKLFYWGDKPPDPKKPEKRALAEIKTRVESLKSGKSNGEPTKKSEGKGKKRKK